MSQSALVFQNTRFDVLDQSGQPWLRLPQIGAALGYKNPYHVQKIYESNKAEFTPSMTALVKLPTAGGEQETRIFSLRGAHLLGMFARTAKAAEFRHWVLDILDGEQTAPAPQPAPKALPMKTGRFSFLSVDNRFIAPLVDLHGDPFETGRGYGREYLSAIRASGSDIHNDRALLMDAIIERLHDLGGTAQWREARRNPGNASPAFAFTRIVAGMFWELDGDAAGQPGRIAA